MNKQDNQKREEAILAIDLWRESKLSQNAFCRREGISRSTFQHWRKRYDVSYEFRVKKSNSPTTKPKESFLSVSIDSPKPQELYDLEVIYETGVRIKCSSSISTTELQKLITLQDF